MDDFMSDKQVAQREQNADHPWLRARSLVLKDGQVVVRIEDAIEAAAGPRDKHERLARLLESDSADGTMPAPGSHEWGLYAHRLLERAEAAAGRETFVGPGGKRIKVKFAEAAAGPRDYKRGPCVHGNPCRESMCVEYGRSDAAAGPRDEITLDELVLRKWADLARRLIAVAPTSAVMDETGISAPHSTPPERQSIRAEADRIILRWLERDLALAKASE